MVLSNELVEEYSKIRGMHKFGIPDEVKPWVAALTIEIKNGAAVQAAEKVNDFLNFTGLNEMLGVSVIVEGNNQL